MIWSRLGRAALLLATAALPSTPVDAQSRVTHRGSVSAVVAALPGVDATDVRVRAEDTLDLDLGPSWSVRAGGWVDGLIGHRRGRSARDFVAQPGETHVRYRHDRFDVTAGFQRVVWGTLDELQPTDVVNPIDVSRFLLDGRTDARLPVLAVRARLYLPRDTTIDAVYAPVFRRGRYDLLDEHDSPFNLAADRCTADACIAALGAAPAVVLPVESDPPARTLGHGSVGARVTRQVRGVDIGVSAWRGWQAFPEYELTATPGRPPFLKETWARSTMVGADAETARGAFTWRAEGAWYLRDDTFQVGAGLDWTRGAWRTFGNVIARRTSTAPDAATNASRDPTCKSLPAGSAPSGATPCVSARSAWSIQSRAPPS